MNIKKITIYALPILAITLLVYTVLGNSAKDDLREVREVKSAISESPEGDWSVAAFAGGCFWCMEPPFEKLEGVLTVVSGYTGGFKENPAYKEVSAGTTGHVEAVEIRYNPNQITYADLLQVFWRQIDPTDAGGQFVDRGEQYRSAIFYHNDEQKQLAEASRTELDASGRFDKPIVTDILPAAAFYAAEEYHQDYYKKNPLRYKFYRNGSGRDRFLEEIWGDERKVTIEHDMSVYQNFDKEERLKSLTKLQFDVTQNEATEKPFNNEYNDNKDEGIYVDIVSGEPLFSSIDKFDSGTGWPSFTHPLEPDNIVYHEDRSLFSVRNEVRSKYADSHLGHVFDDGPQPTGLRYCLNSASLKFIPKADLEKEGYGQYMKLFN